MCLAILLGSQGNQQILQYYQKKRRYLGFSAQKCAFATPFSSRVGGHFHVPQFRVQCLINLRLVLINTTR